MLGEGEEDAATCARAKLPLPPAAAAKFAAKDATLSSTWDLAVVTVEIDLECGLGEGGAGAAGPTLASFCSSCCGCGICCCSCSRRRASLLLASLLSTQPIFCYLLH